MPMESMPASGQYRLAIWRVCDQTRFRIGRRIAVFSVFVPSSRNRLFPSIINEESKINIGIPTINDQTAKLRFPMNISSNISAMTMIEMNIKTLMMPRKVLTIIHICSVSVVWSGLSRADNLSMKESLLMLSPATFI